MSKSSSSSSFSIRTARRALQESHRVLQRVAVGVAHMRASVRHSEQALAASRETLRNTTSRDRKVGDDA
jgi:hypothetical protein